MNSKTFSNANKTRLIITILVVVCVIVQLNIFFNQDTSWLMHAGKRLLAGGDYLHDFYEPNPPMSIFIYLPAVLLAQLLNTSFMFSSLIYILFIGLLSSYLCASFLSRIFSKADSLAYLFFLTTLAFVFFILPAGEFGEREHIMLLLIAPYIFLLCLQVENYPVSFDERLLSSVMAGIGFVIKPHFLIIYLLLELFFIFSKKNIWIFFRLESLIIFIIGIGYFLSVFLITPEYISSILPMLVKYYYISFGSSWYLVLSDGLFLYVVLIQILYLCLRQYSDNKKLTDILFVTSLGMLLVYLLQRTNWYYHILPALSTSTLLLTLIAADVLNQEETSKLLGCNTKAQKKILYGFFIFLLAFPCLTAADHIAQLFWAKKHSSRHKFIRLINQESHSKIIYFFSDLMTPTYPIVDYTQAESASRFPCLWMFLSIEFNFKNTQDPLLIKNYKKDQKFFTDLVIKDLIRKKPDLIFVQLESVNWKRSIGVTVDYLNVFSKDPRFNSIWKNYTFFERLGDYAIYKRS